MSKRTTEVRVELDPHAGGSRSGQWRVESSTRGVVSNHRLKRAAIDRGRQHARGQAPSVLKIQQSDGTWRTEATYR
ncbi:MAG: DUF2188 domain-containing protein [Halodesulfurarchaeum sp.]